jgi:adenylyltransferase/sulfurtransferase
MKEITPTEYAAWVQENKPHQLVDVREPFEREIADLGGDGIPVAQIISRSDEVRKDVPVVVHCRSGKRSADAITQLEHLGYENLYNLKGGILAYSDDVDGTIPKY